MMTRRRRLLLMAVAALVAWFAMVTVTWAVRPLSDTMPVGRDPDGLVYRRTVCGTLFDSNPTAGVTVPEPTTPATLDLTKYLPFGFPRPPCVLVHHEARVLYAIDTTAFWLGLAALAFIARRTRPRAPDSAEEPALQPVG